MVWGKSNSKETSDDTKGQHKSQSLDGDTAMPCLERIVIDEVKVSSKHRELDPEKVKAIAASMAKIGLRTPITVRRIKKALGATVLALVAGGYRLAAAKTLGWKHIDALVMEGNETDARVWQLIENLYRAELTALERAEHVAELAQLVLESAKGVQLAPPGGQQPHDLGIKKAAKALGFSREEVRRSLQIAGISAEAKEKATELGLDKKQSPLLKIAKEVGSEAQLAKIEEIKSAAPGKLKSKTKKSRKPATKDEQETDEQEEKDSPPLAPESNEEEPDFEPQELEEPTNRDGDAEKDRLYDELKAAWDNAPKSVRKRFIRKVLHLDLDGISEEVWTA